MNIDALDKKILSVLMAQARVKWTALADEFGVSAPAISDRVRRLERSGLITGYAAKLDAEALGFDVTAFVMVTLDHPQHRQGFVDFVLANGAIQSCHHVAGEGDYLLRVCCRSMAALEQLLSDDLKSLAGVVQTRTTISLRSVKDTTALPIAQAAVERDM